MSNIPSPQLPQPASDEGGITMQADSIKVGGDVVGRDKTTTQDVNTGGGAYIPGRVDTAGGDFVGHDKITYGLTAEQVGTLLVQISKDFQPKPFDGHCPYLGLEAFGEEDAEYFFGREKLTSELVERVKHSRFVVIAGPSGSGKSSLVRAGLVHALRRGALACSERWHYTILTPGRYPLQELAGVISSWRNTLDAGDEFRTKGMTDATALHRWAEIELGEGHDRRAVIVVDQFEEAFAQVAQEAERLAFLNLLTYAATAEGGRVTVLFVLRSDFVSNCATYPDLNALLNLQFFQVGAMQPYELMSAIARPALQVGLHIDPDLIAQIINDMQDQPGALPLMQFALKDLFDVQQTAGALTVLTLEGYLARGGLHKALERHADAAFAQLNPAEQELARDIFAKLIQPGHGTQDTRRMASFDELIPVGTDAVQVEAVVRRLAEPRLRLIITDERDEGGTRTRTATIAHETLIDAWPRLRRLVDENRELIALQNGMADDAYTWEQRGRDPSYLYRGAQLATVREKLLTKQLRLSRPVQAFIDASLKAENAARRARNRAISVVGALLFAATIISIIFGLQSNENERQAQAANTQSAQSLGTAQAEAQYRATAEANVIAQRDEAQRQANLAISRHLAAQALALTDDHFDLSVLLSVEALHLADTLEARNSLLTELYHHSRILGYLRGHGSNLTSVAFSPDGKLLASGSADGAILLWDVTSHQFLDQLTTYRVTSVAFSPDSKLFASGSSDGTVQLWDSVTRQPLGEPLKFGDQAGRVTSVTFSPDGKLLANGNGNRTVQLWNVATHLPLETFIGHDGAVLSVAFSPNGKLLASASLDKTVRLWDVATKQPLGIPLIGHAGEVTSLAFSPDGKLLASGSVDRTVQLWDVATHRTLGTPLMGHTGTVFSVAFSPDGKRLASGSWDRTIILWDIVAHRPWSEPLTGHLGAVLSVTFSPDGKLLASSSWDRTALLWDAMPYQRFADLLSGHSQEVTSVAFSPDGKVFASGSADKSVQLWDTATHQPLGTPLAGHEGRVTSIAFSPDGKVLASGSADKSVQLWDTATHQPLGTPLIGHDDEVTSIAFSPDGKLLASGSMDRTMQLWDVATRQPLGKPIRWRSTVFSLVFSPDGKQLALGSGDSTIQLWDVATKQPSGIPITGHGDVVTSIAFSPDGKMLASGGEDGTVRLWDVSTHRPLGEPLFGHTDQVNSVAFSPDGNLLASGSLDKAVQLWDTVSRQPLGISFMEHSDGVTSVAFSPDGKLLASGSADRTALLWDINVESWEARACNIVARNLSQDEWEQYLGDEPYHKICPGLPKGIPVDILLSPATLASPQEIQFILASGLNTCSQWLVFHTFRDQNLEIYRLDGVEGEPNAKLYNLSQSDSVDSRPSRSPNDAWIVFESDRDGNVELYLTDNEGRSQIRLTVTQANNINPMFGPDNQTVIYQSDRNGNWDIFSIDLKTGLERQLTTDSHNDVHPYWSPDPNWITFESDRSGSLNLYLLDLSTGNEFQVTRDVTENIFPAWSPNGKSLAFLSNQEGRWDLYVVDINGKNLKQITHGDGDTGNHTWSPEGDRLAYQVALNGNMDVYTYDLHMDTQYRLTDYAGPDSAPTWDCSGSRIAFTSLRDRNPNVFEVAWQGGPQSNLTNHLATDKWSLWSPSKETGSRGH